MNEVVVEGARSGQLRAGPGHVVGSALPGQPGNAVIAGRRTLYGGPFKHLDSLEPGDRIVVTTGQGKSTYRVTGIAKSYGAVHGSVFGDYGDNRLTLFTADPPFRASRRLVVTAKLVERPYEATELRTDARRRGTRSHRRAGFDRGRARVARTAGRAPAARGVRDDALVTMDGLGRVRSGVGPGHVALLRARRAVAPRHALSDSQKSLRLYLGVACSVPRVHSGLAE